MSFRFKKFPVYKDIREFIKLIFIITSKFPQIYQYDLGSQIRRATISILLNLAEGSGRNSDKEFNRFLLISIGSIDEVVAALDIALDNNLITQNSYSQIVEKAESIKNQLGGFSKKLKGQS
ncbi:MAG: four helix bundle protein [Patescibacteria group bacterium]|nr:four helix bundle protein [Patescibacteria group bacterium]